MSKKSTSIPKSTKFEDALGELETLIEQLETGDQSLEESLVQFERGMALSQFCQNSLSDAEKKVKILIADKDSEDDALADFEQ
jgi:exodeoxyribonuclease VII small subunit